MIAITRLDGSTLVVNADLIETIEHSGDTVVTLVSGTRFVARESVAELIDAVVRFRTAVLVHAEKASYPAIVERGDPPPGSTVAPAQAAKVIPMTSGRRSPEPEG